MISSLAAKIVAALERNQIIQPDAAEIYQYGIEMLIATLLNLMIVVAVGLAFQELLAAALFFLLFAWIRSNTGGYHADTYWKCNGIFAINLILVLLWIKFGIAYYNYVMHLLFLLFYFLLVIRHAPIENPNKPICAPQKRKLKWRCIAIGLALGIVSVVIWWAWGLKPYAVLLGVTMLSVAISMAVPVWVCGRRKRSSGDSGSKCDESIET